MAKTIKEKYKEFDDHMTDVGKDLGRAIIKIDKALKRKKDERTQRKEEKEKVREEQEERTLVLPWTFKYEILGYFFAIVVVTFVIGLPFTKPWSYLGNYYDSSSFGSNPSLNEFTADSHEKLPVISYPILEDSSISTETTEENRENRKNEVNEENADNTEDSTFVTDTSETDTVEEKTEHNSIVEEANETNEIPLVSEYDICLLVQAIQHETKIFEGTNVYNTVQQYMAASIINRLGTSGFGIGGSTAYSVYEILSNSNQYGNILWELDYFDPYDQTTTNNVYAVLNGTAYTPTDLYYERCSNVGEDYYSAQENFYSQYPGAYGMQIVYMEMSPEGRYIIFATNPSGAYAS